VLKTALCEGEMPSGAVAYCYPVLGWASDRVGENPNVRPG
jgi:hypothetical protein